MSFFRLLFSHQLALVVAFTTTAFSADTPAQSADIYNNELYKHGGNVPAQPHQLSAAEEKEVLNDVTAPEGFTASLFSPWQMANYPTCISAAPNGDLYVSSDGNGSGGVGRARGRVLRLRDTDGDGRADHVSEFIKEVDSPRGLIWDHDRLYLLHPPHLSVYHDKNRDGIAESSEVLIDGIAFGPKERNADHTTNGIEMGPDGWIYIAVGDFGFMNAVGKDGRTLQMRGGGVVRVKPDGSGMEIFSDGTRNIYGIAISPTLDLFARDNTNDGGGWNVRFHHLSGLEDHGYPRLYMNFKDEIVDPLDDYGGGSGVGAFYLEEPGIPAQWNNRSYTLDWGQKGSFRHSVKAKGAGFEEVAKPTLFIKMTRPTDASVDASSAIYQSSWKGPASYSWAGIEHGYITKVAPSGFQAETLPDYDFASDLLLITEIRNANSYTRRMLAQRALMRRPIFSESRDALLEVINDSKVPLQNRITALYAYTNTGIGSDDRELLTPLITSITEKDPLLPFLTRASGDMGLALRTEGKLGSAPTSFLIKQLQSSSPRNILEAIIATTRQGQKRLAPHIAVHLTNTDDLIQHTAFRALARLTAIEAVLPYLDSTDARTRSAASWALMRMHSKETVSALIAKLEAQPSPDKRQPILAALCRLFFVEAEWKGGSWSTRPDTRGPYYEPVKWEQSARILAKLNEILENPATTKGENSTVIALIGKNRIPNNKGLQRIIDLARTDPSLQPALLNQLQEVSVIPNEAIPLVIATANNKENPSPTHKQALEILCGIDHPRAFEAIMNSLEAIHTDPQSGIIRQHAREALLSSPKLENYIHGFEKLFLDNPHVPKGKWASNALLKIAEGKNIGPEAAEIAKHTIAAGREKSDAHWYTIVEASFWTQLTSAAPLVLEMLTHQNKPYADFAMRTAQRLKLDIPKNLLANIQSITITAVPSQIRFDQKSIKVKVGQKILLKFTNPDKLAHNLVIVQPNTFQEVSKAAIALGNEGFKKGWLPDHPAIIAATKMLDYNTEETIEFTLDKPGTYQFLCTFPGHEYTMLGDLIAE